MKIIVSLGLLDHNETNKRIKEIINLSKNKLALKKLVFYTTYPHIQLNIKTQI